MILCISKVFGSRVGAKEIYAINITETASGKHKQVGQTFLQFLFTGYNSELTFLSSATR